jgi:hypothetical protein
MKHTIMREFEPQRTGGVKHTTWKDILYIFVFLTIVLGLIKNTHIPSPQLIRPIPVQAEEIIPSPTVTPTPIAVPDGREAIVAYIREVFGEHSDKALLLLTCENSELNPEAVNGFGNSPEGSLDIGLFQINNYWQGVSNQAFLRDYKINTLIAWNIYSRDGYSFKLWTCGRKLGI